MRDRRAVARYAGLTGSRSMRREKGLARSGNARVRRGMIQLAWRFLDFQKESALAKWFKARTENARGSRKKMIVALARKLLIALLTASPRAGSVSVWVGTKKRALQVEQRNSGIKK